ncbi:DUF4227 family protein [Xylanibacillus composti]|uniref:DUF4227 family protein n=1 Tax=Xylanibacillus composti TaxID=1572762 RepID=A0A8J4H6J2_9BACL|nr:DUF4227 family protein [Xylanibacillus composti]MDT9726661.1 DUF4227 family protein [Xylanibacillus composti]GIQ69408.1 hypothetical protein XYCOK13_22320 [Xylanibacillus composti]
MIVHLRKWLERLKFLLLFLLLTYLFSHVFQALSAWMEPNDPYRKPNGHAVKAFQEQEAQHAVEDMTVMERLRLFYWYGE